MNNIRIEIKPFNAFSIDELYKVLALRNEIFIVEQNCVYEDIDGSDDKADHLMFWDGDLLVAYARLFDYGVKYEDAACIGRVLVKQEYRKFGFGHQLIKQALRYIHENYATESVEIGAQEHLSDFYESHGFRITSESYLEDGIPHIQMRIS